ncbi:Barstar (barnase inhibitor) [compost metagenome]
MAREDEVKIERSDVKTSGELQQRLMNALHFPGWYGRNWDAFWDAITGLVAMPYRLRLQGWADFERRLPNEAEQLRKCLIQMQAELPSLATVVIYA